MGVALLWLGSESNRSDCFTPEFMNAEWIARRQFERHSAYRYVLKWPTQIDVPFGCRDAVMYR